MPTEEHTTSGEGIYQKKWGILFLLDIGELAPCWPGIFPMIEKKALTDEDIRSLIAYNDIVEQSEEYQSDIADLVRALKAAYQKEENEEN